jgi:hypothetical protein
MALKSWNARNITSCNICFRLDWQRSASFWPLKAKIKGSLVRPALPSGRSAPAQTVKIALMVRLVIVVILLLLNLIGVGTGLDMPRLTPQQ